MDSVRCEGDDVMSRVSWAEGARVVWDVVLSSRPIKRAFGTFASNGTYVAAQGLRVF
ncbi:hypothetical protein RBSWK_03413 [Rhodopirellula baltica SWK14]|uniref:Uncharacterized protein n=1 Tax=Rhodopirellula baltica SWK14 TaxID=993516 RepID=L7CF63_RHOBT|nr:hypothetical protein RBSWK_03413 [Rhodopirellula baltica SWK14]